MALKLNGKDDRLRRADFKALASTAGMKATDADAAIDKLLSSLSNGLDKLQLSPPLMDGSQGAEAAANMRNIVRDRISGFAG
jgi:serine/threonine-protein kinase HipA